MNNIPSCYDLEGVHKFRKRSKIDLLNEIDRLKKIEAWSLKSVKWLNEKDNEIAKIEQHTKEAIKLALASEVRPVKDYPIYKEWIPFERAIHAIDSAGVK